MPNNAIGRSLPRLEDRLLLTGRGSFAADMTFPGEWIMRVVRSPVAHGVIRSINDLEARALPGVHAVWSHKEVAHLPPIPFRLTGLQTLEPYRQPILAHRVVRYVGEPVALIFAEDPYIAEDAAELLELDIEARQPVMHVLEEPKEFEKGVSTEADIIRKGYGDVAQAFREAAAIVSLELSIGRHSGVPLETRGAIATYNPLSDLLEMYGAAKVPHWNRDTLARMLGRPLKSMHLHEGHVGGGFGIRGEIYPEDVAVCAAALAFKRPIKWVEDRREHLIAANHSRQQTHRIQAAVDKDGHILAIDDTFFHDNGAYMRTHAATVPDLAAAMLPGPYRVPAYRATGYLRLTNKTPCGTYRAPGRFESTFVRERLMDAIAEQCGFDKIEVRRRNLLDKGAMPYARQLDTLGTEIIYDSGDYELLLDKALSLTGWDGLRAEIDARRDRGEKVGLGVAMFVEKSGLGPFDTVRITIADDRIEVVTGNASVGQGIETVIAQICADSLGVRYDTVDVIHGQTDRIERGMGAFASRVTVMCGEATRLAAVQLRAQALTAACELMQTSLDVIDIINGEIVRLDDSGASMPLKQLSGLSAEATFESNHMVYPYGVHVAAARVDSETGQVTIERYAIAYDIGRAVNPRLVEGQIVGGLAQGIGGALYEEFQYDETGEPLSVTLADYLMPTAREIPAVEVLITEDAPSPLNTLGLKGAGEGGTNAAGAAIASAIDQAIGIPGAICELPVSSSRLLDLMRCANTEL